MPKKKKILVSIAHDGVIYLPEIEIELDASKVPAMLKNLQDLAAGKKGEAKPGEPINPAEQPE